MLGLIIPGAIFGLVVLYLLEIIFGPWPKEHPQPIPVSNSPAALPGNAEPVTFVVEDIPLSGTFYLPAGNRLNLPCIVMNHGFGGTRDFALQRYADRFTAAGYAVLTYDYRYFGDSGGVPRQWWAGRKQMDDLRGAITFARSRNEIDPAQIILWGTSGGAPLGFLAAAEDKEIAGVISQCGGLDHKADEKLYFERESKGTFFRILMHGQRDKGRSRFGLSVHHLSIVGRPGTLAILSAPGAYDGYARLAAESTTFRNEIAARTMLTMPPGSPVDAAPRVKCPVLVIACEKDNLASPQSHVRIVENLGGPSKVVSFPISHFEVYEGEWLEKAAGEMLGFIRNLAGE